MWNADYPYKVTIRDGSSVYITRYRTFGEAVAVYIEHLNRTVSEIEIKLIEH